MLFNSIDFALFLPIVFLLYWFVCQRNLKIQNLLIVVASYVFYGWWDWRFLSLIVFSTLIDYSVGNILRNETRKYYRRIYLWISICVNIGFLGFFKYFNFFVESFKDAFLFFGKEIEGTTLDIILPVGISFYTFQTLSYAKLLVVGWSMQMLVSSTPTMQTIPRFILLTSFMLIFIFIFIYIYI